MPEQTLRDYLNSIDPDSKIAIGTMNGCGYIFFGTAGQTDQILKDFEKRHAYMVRTSWSNTMDDYIHPLDRVVCDHYQKFVDDCEAIIVSGDEKGTYWLEREYNKSHKVA